MTTQPATSDRKLTHTFDTATLSEREKSLIERLRELPHGSIEVFMQDSQILRIVVKESLKL